MKKIIKKNLYYEINFQLILIAINFGFKYFHLFIYLINLNNN